MVDAVTIPARFNGPPGSGNGGYVCGVVAETIGASASVRLSAPPPLDVPLLRTRDGDGVVHLLHGEEMIAAGSVAQPAAIAPDAPTVREATIAAAAYAGLDPQRHPFPTCFVCGPLRHDGLRIFPGPVNGHGVLACVWQPADDLATSGVVDPRFVWAALDCPTGFACMPPGSRTVLATMTATLHADVEPGRDYVITAWRIASEGRKHRGGAVLTDADGRRVATAEALWISLRG
ncbi:PaaI family thioesterase [Solirubrobacter phytolaccae]|nr:hypothetical protein [Solirubrobacter phytolaccae]